MGKKEKFSKKNLLEIILEVRFSNNLLQRKRIQERNFLSKDFFKKNFCKYFSFKSLWCVEIKFGHFFFHKKIQKKKKKQIKDVDF